MNFFYKQVDNKCILIKDWANDQEITIFLKYFKINFEALTIITQI